MARVVKVTLRAEIAEYAAAMEEAANKTRTVGTESEKLAQKREAFQKLGTGLLVVGGAMTALTLAVAKTGIEYNTLQQTSRAALTTLLGGAEQANAQMDKLDAFARTSPFAKTTFITAQQQMLAFGVETQKVIPYLDAIQDAVAAAGGSNQELAEIAFIMAQISSAGKITAQDLLQFGQRGVNAAELIGSQMGKTGAQIRDEITAGTLDADQALDALAAGMKDRFDGAAANVKETFAGAMDRVKAAWRDMSAELMKPLVDPSGGGALVDFLNWTADVMRAIQALPEPIKLTGGALFALAGFVALASGAVLSATPRIVAMKAAFMELSGTMRGFALVGGGAVIALTAMVAIIGAVAAAQAAAQAKAEAYADTLEEGTNKITRSTREMAKEALAAKNSFLWIEQDSAYDAAEKLGISLDLVTDAATGNVEAMKELQAQIDEGALAHKGLARGSLEYANSAVDIENAVRGEADSLERAIEMAEQKQRADEEGVDSAAASQAAFEEQAQAAEDLQKALEAASDALDEVAGSSMSMAEAKDAALSSINALKEAAEAEGAALDGTDAASLKFRDSIREVEQAHRDSADAIVQNGGTLAEAQAEWDKGRESVIGMLVAKGMDREEAIRWADQQLGSASQVKAGIDEVYRAWLNLPENKQTKYEVEMAEALRKLEAVREKISQIPGYRSITLETIEMGNRTATANYQGGMYANGVKHFASGGFASGIYAGVTGGISDRDRIFAEKDMGVPWETYISGRAQDRNRNIGIWQQTGQMLGVQQQSPVDVSGLLDGMSIRGSLDLGNGLTGFVDGRIVQHDDAQSRKIRRGVSGR